MKAIELTKNPTFKVLKGKNETSVIQTPSLTLVTKNSETPSEDSGTDEVITDPQKPGDIPTQITGYLRYQRYDFF